ncbi:MAG: type II toxin-antitoxin system Phd/YefM family antitoxin [Solirubrobacteraceae bacterium]
MARSIPQRELRNDIARVLREVAAGDELTVTVRGRPVAELRPANAAARRLAPVGAVARELRALGPDRDWADEQLADRDQLGYLHEL